MSRIDDSIARIGILAEYTTRRHGRTLIIRLAGLLDVRANESANHENFGDLAIAGADPRWKLIPRQERDPQRRELSGSRGLQSDVASDSARSRPRALAANKKAREYRDRNVYFFQSYEQRLVRAHSARVLTRFAIVAREEALRAKASRSPFKEFSGANSRGRIQRSERYPRQRCNAFARIR